jgi:hypothetical protein
VFVPRLALSLGLLLAVTFCGVLAVLKLQPAAQPVAGVAVTADPPESSWERVRWLDKTARLLRGGEGLGPQDDMHALLAMSREQVARHFMADPRFGDTILDFNLYFLGFKVDALKVDGAYDRPAFDFSNAVASAQAMLQGGDYLSLFDLQSTRYFMPPLRSTPVDDPPLLAEDTGLDAAALRRKAVGELHDALVNVLAWGERTPADQVYAFCTSIFAVTTKTDWWHSRVMRAFDDAESFGLTRGKAVVAPLDKLGHTAWQACWGRGDPAPTVAELAAAVRAALERYDATFAEVLKHEPTAYRPRRVQDFRAFDLGAFADTPTWVAFGYEQGLALPNSSTNANRRRAAYILKRFFCDDLTPVGVEAPRPDVSQHVTGPLAQPSCQSCHYKLDPMAGFFRNHGAFFFDFSQTSHLTFDDLAETERKRYTIGWQASPQANRAWNVGYIRSPVQDAVNSYGESIADLSRIIRAAPEARQCLMRRLVEYSVAENQAVDPGWLDGLARSFEREAAANSAEAMRNALVRVVTSKAFSRHDADPEQCYDAAPGGQPADRPPCRIAFLVEKNCARCHDNTLPGSGGLDLTRWTDGRFPHLDASRHPVPVGESLDRLIQRLGSDDPDKRMPRGIGMTSQDRQALYRWAERERARVKP